MRVDVVVYPAMQESLAQEILRKLQAASRVALVLHRRPDADSLGSAAAFAALLSAQAIPYSFYCVTALPSEAHYFGIDQGNCLNAEGLIKANPDVVCTFDAGDLIHAGLTPSPYPHPTCGLPLPEGEGGVRGQPFIINIDHHATNTRFGMLNVVEVKCASTTEVVYRLLHLLHAPISARVAGYLLAGLLHDTDHFLNPATSGPALEMAGQLMGHGVSLSELRQLLFERWSMGALRLIGEVLSRLKHNRRYGMAITYVTEEDVARHGVSFDEVEGIANMLNALGEVRAMCLLKASNGHIRGSFRTTREDVNVGGLAELFGGGGHRKASGFTIRGALQIEEGRVKVI